VHRVPIHALNHLGLSSPDLPRLVAFYRDALGFAETISFSWPVGNVAADEGLGLVDTAADVTILNAGNIYLELFRFHSPEPAPQAPDRPVQDEGITHLCLEVTDTDLVFDRLVAAGAAVEAEPVSVMGVIRIASVRDPDGNVVELQQTLKDGSPTDARLLEVVATPPAGPDDERKVVTPAEGVLGVNHVGLSTGSLDEHVAFYRDAAGLREHARSGWDTTERDGDPATGGTGSKAEHVLLHAGNVFLDLTEYAAPRGAALDPQRPINDHGLTHLCFDVSDIDELHASMVEGGMTFHRAPAAMPAGLSAMGYARDPFGNALELIENRSPKAFMWCGHLRSLTELS
jgi:catechol 2,3-dioxygenase-like lactoylglutathione lyase family enzyme